MRSIDKPRLPGIGTLSQGCLLLAAVMTALAASAAESVVDQHQLGTKYSPLTQINKNNVANLELAWEYHTGDLPPADLKNLQIRDYSPEGADALKTLGASVATMTASDVYNAIQRGLCDGLISSLQTTRTSIERVQPVSTSAMRQSTV